MTTNIIDPIDAYLLSIGKTTIGRQIRRYTFLSGYALRTDAEESELVELRTLVQAAGVIGPGWEEVPREHLPEL